MARRRVYDEADARTLVEASSRWRSDVVIRLGKAPIGEPYHRALSGILDGLDDLAEAVTGNRRLHHQKSATTPGPTLGEQEAERRRREAREA